MKKIKLIKRYSFNPELRWYRDNLTGKSVSLREVKKYGGSRWENDSKLIFEIVEVKAKNESEA